MYEIYITKNFAKELKKLNEKERERIKEKLKATKENPFLYFERMKASPLFKIRVGKFRIRARINLSKKEIWPLSIKLRKNAYKKHNKIE
jgi:mRNA-degrading endonuclease RelE of RelBE toxin-antitoxin system